MKYKHRRQLTRTRQTVQTITRLEEGPWRWALGVEAGLATGAAIFLFYLAGHPFLGNMASLGALAVLYGAKRTTKQRLLVMLFVGIGLILASAAGAFCAAYEWLSFLTLIIITALASIITAGTGTGAPGAMMFVLVAAISNRFALQPVSPVTYDSHIIPFVIGVGVVVSWLVVATLSLFPFHRPAENDPALPPLTYRIHLKREDILVTARLVAGVAAAILLSGPLNITRVHWVVVAVVAILQAGFDRRLSTVRAFQRVLGTVIGVLVFELLHVLGPKGLWLILIVMLLQFATQVVVARNYVLGLLFITPMALLIVTSSQMADTYITAKERVIDTLIGAALAIVVFWLEEIVAWLLPEKKVDKLTS